MTTKKLTPGRIKQLASLRPWKSHDGLKVGDKVFGLRLPLTYQWKLQSMEPKQRTALMRKAIMDYLDSITQSQD